MGPASRREQIIAGLTEHPNAALREIARAVDVPPKTLRSVRARLANSQPLRRSPQQPLELSDVLPAPTRTEHWHRISPSLLGRTAPCPPASWSEPACRWRTSRAMPRLFDRAGCTRLSTRPAGECCSGRTSRHAGKRERSGDVGDWSNRPVARCRGLPFYWLLHRPSLPCPPLPGSHVRRQPRPLAQ